jgi:hypothetical protein
MSNVAAPNEVSVIGCLALRDRTGIRRKCAPHLGLQLGGRRDGKKQQMRMSGKSTALKTGLERCFARRIGLSLDPRRQESVFLVEMREIIGCLAVEGRRFGADRRPRSVGRR